MEGTTYDLTADIHGAVSGSGWLIATGGIAAASFAAGRLTPGLSQRDAIGSSELAATAVNEIADQVWDEAIAGHLTAGNDRRKTQFDWHGSLHGDFPGFIRRHGNYHRSG